MHCSKLQVKLEICKGPNSPKTSSKMRDFYRIPSLIAVDGRIPGLEDGYQLARGYGHIVINDDEEERMKCIEHLTRELEEFTRGLLEGVDIPPELAIPFKSLAHDTYDEDCSFHHGDRGDVKCHKCRRFRFVL